MRACVHAFSRRAALQLCASLSSGALLAGCRTATQPGQAEQPRQPRGPVKIVFWCYGGGGTAEQLFRTAVEEYRQKFPDITVEFTGIPSGDIQQKVLVSWTSDVIPDIVMDSWRGFLRFMDSGLFLDITNEFAKRRYKPSDFYETALKAYQIDGKQFGMPQGWGTSLYAMNLDLFESSGVRLAPDFDETWTQDDLVQMLKLVVRYDATGRMSPYGGADDSIFFYWLYSYGGDFLTPDQSRAAVTAPEALAAAEQSRTDPAHAKWIPDLSDIYNKYTRQLRTGEAGPREAMANMANDINAVLAEYQRSKGR